MFLYNVFQCRCKNSESRTAACVTKEGIVLSDDRCDLSRKPITNRSCETTACERTNRHWYMSEWGEVSSVLIRPY